MISPTPAGVVRRSAVSVSRRVAPLLAPPARGSVLATFTRSAYVEIDSRIVVLADALLLNGPLNVLLSLEHAQTRQEAGLCDGLAPGMAATMRDGILDLGPSCRIDIRQARLWDPRLTPIGDTGRRARMESALDAIRTILDAGAPRESLARPRARPPRAESGMTRLAHALRTGDAQRAGHLAGQAAEELAGLGPGLTPSGDDVLAGAMIAAAVLVPARAGILGERIVAAVRGRTTRISEAYLEAAAAGEAGEAWHRLAAALGARRNPAGSTDLDGAVRQIMAFGETSGSDMLAGFVLGMTELLGHLPRSTE